MRFGRVIGRVVTSQVDASLKGARWLMVSPMGSGEFREHENPRISTQPSCVVYDDLGAGEGDIIGFTEGGEATWPFDRPVPVDAYNAIIVDRIQFKSDN